MLQEEDKKNKEKMIGFYFTMTSFVWGILSGAIFYRQVGHEVGRGLRSGSDMVG